MNRNIFLITFLLISLITFSQQNFYPAEIIKSDSTKISGLIKYIETSKTPQEFLFKENENSNTITLNFGDIISVDVINKVKYVKRKVNVSNHSSSLNYLDDYKEFKLLEKTCFIEQLNEGEYKLYFLSDSNVSQFFYSKPNSQSIYPLLNKKYYNENGSIVTNEDFKKEIYINLNCDKNISLKFKVNNLEYKEEVLKAYFDEVNECLTGVKQIQKQKKYGYTNINLISDLSFVKFKEYNVDFGNKTLINFGGEIEYILPYYNYLFALEFIPSINFYKNNGTYNNEKLIYQADNLYYQDPLNGKSANFEATVFSMPLNLKIYPINRKMKIYTSLTLFNIFSFGKGKMNFENAPSFEPNFIPPFYGFFEIGGSFRKIGISFKKLRKFESNSQFFDGFAISLKYNLYSSKE